MTNGLVHLCNQSQTLRAWAVPVGAGGTNVRLELAVNKSGSQEILGTELVALTTANADFRAYSERDLGSGGLAKGYESSRALQSWKGH